MVEKKAESKKEKTSLEGEVKEGSDVVEIPVGSFLSGIRKNPWVVSTIVLAIVLVILLFWRSGSGGVVSTGSVVSGDIAAQNLLSFINSQGQGEAKLVSTEKEGQLYKVIVNYKDQEIPVFISLDGEYLITDRIPLSGNAALGTDANGDSGTTGNSERVDVEEGDAPVLGNKTASVAIIEFSDYQCPFCGRFYLETLPELKKEYIDTGKAKLVFRDFPLDFHQEAQKAAEAARCARDQKGDSAYFKMHDKLFDNQESLSVVNYKKWAREIGLDGAKFDKCLDDGKFEEVVKEDLAYGQTVGVSGTPAFFINGVLVEGAQQISVFKQVIDAELNK